MWATVEFGDDGEDRIPSVLLVADDVTCHFIGPRICYTENGR